MVTMRHWRMETVTTTAAQPPMKKATLITKILDPLEGTSKQYQSANQSIYVSWME